MPYQELYHEVFAHTSFPMASAKGNCNHISCLLFSMAFTCKVMLFKRHAVSEIIEKKLIKGLFTLLSLSSRSLTNMTHAMEDFRFADSSKIPASNKLI